MTANPLDKIKVAIVVFAMPGCPACHEYLPRLYKQIEGYQQLKIPFVIYQPGETLKPGDMPVFVYDTTSQDPTVQELANRHEIKNLPTTLILPQIGYPAKYEGALPPGDIYNLLNAAMAANR